MRRNYCWLATLAAWTILPILRNPLAQEEPRDNPPKRFIDNDDTIYATSAGRNVFDGKSLRDNEESYREEIVGNSPTPEKLFRNFLDGETETKDSKKDTQEVNAQDVVHSNSSNTSNDKFVSEDGESIGKFRAVHAESKTRNIQEDSNEVKKDINFRKRFPSGKYDPEKLLEDTRFSIWTSYRKTPNFLRKGEMGNSNIEDFGIRYNRLANKERNEEIDVPRNNQETEEVSDERKVEENRFLESIGNTDDRSTECVECEPRRIDSMEMAVGGEPQNIARDKSESKGETAESLDDATIHEEVNCEKLLKRKVRFGFFRKYDHLPKTDVTRKSRISLKADNGQASYLHGTRLKLKMSTDGRLIKEIVRRENFRRKRSLSTDENCPWVIVDESSESKALGSSRIFRYPIKNRMDGPLPEDNHKGATSEDTRNLFYRPKRLAGNFKRDFRRPIEPHRYIDEPHSADFHLPDMFLRNSSDTSASATPRNITTRNWSQSVNTEGPHTNPPGNDSQSTSSTPGSDEHKEEAKKKSSFTLTNHSPRSKSSGYNSVGVFDLKRFDENQPSIELDSIAVPSNTKKNFIVPRRVIAHTHGESANAKNFQGSFRQDEVTEFYGSGEYKKGGGTGDASKLRGQGTNELSESIDTSQRKNDKYFDPARSGVISTTEIKGKDTKKRSNANITGIARSSVAWKNNTTTRYVGDFSAPDDTSSSDSSKINDNPTRANEYISPLEGEVPHRKSRIKPASSDKDNNLPIPPSGGDETKESIYTANTEKNGLIQAGKFQQELAGRTGGTKRTMYSNLVGEIGSVPRGIDSQTSMKVTNGSADRPNNWSRLTNSSSAENSYTMAREGLSAEKNVSEKKERTVEEDVEENYPISEGFHTIGNDVLLTTKFPVAETEYEQDLIMTVTQNPYDPTFFTEERIYPSSAHGTLKQNAKHEVTLSKENPRTSKLNISARFLTAPREVAEMNGGARSILRTTSGNTTAAYSGMHFSSTRSIDEAEMQPAMKKSSPIEMLRRGDGKIDEPVPPRNQQFFVSMSSRKDKQVRKMIVAKTSQDDISRRDDKDQGTLRNYGYNNLVERVDKYIRLRKEGHLKSYEKTNFSVALETRSGGRTMENSGARSGQETSTTDEDERYQSSALMSAKVVAKRPLLQGIAPETSSPFVAFQRAQAPQTSLVTPRTLVEEKPDVGSIDHPPPTTQRSGNDPIQLHQPSEFSPSRDLVNYQAGLQRSSETPITSEQPIIHLRDRFEGSSIIEGAFINNEDVSASSADIKSSGKKCRTDCRSNFIRSFGRRHVINSSRRTDHSSTAPAELTTPVENDSWQISNQSTNLAEISSSPLTDRLSGKPSTVDVEGLEPSTARISTSTQGYAADPADNPVNLDGSSIHSNLSATTNKYSWWSRIESTTSSEDANPTEYSDVYLTISSSGPLDNTSFRLDPWRVNGETDNSSTQEPTAVDQWPVKHSAVVEGDLVLGGLMMVHEREDTHTCGPVMPQGGVQALEAMLYTLDKLNDRNIVPGVKIGAHILDDCDKDTYGLEMAVDFIKGSISNIDGAEYHCNRTAVRKVISGVVGAASSVTSIQVANLLRLFRIPQVSFFSTSPELSNKQRFEYFTRTIPSDHYQVKAMVDIVRKMGWSYISIIYEESNYGIKAFEELEELLKKHQICIAIKEKLVKDSGVAEETAYDNIVLKLLTKPRARGCIIFGSDQEVAGVMRAVRRCNATGAFSWIGSDGWSARGLVSDGNEPEVEGTLSVQPQANPVRGFEEYFLNLTVENNRRNPWFVEFWEDHFQCRYPNASYTPYNKKYTRTCTTKERLTKQSTAFEDQLQFVSDAVMAFAYAFRDMHRDLCGGKAGLCEAMKPTKGTELLKYLRKVDFEGLSGDKFKFDKNGDGPARYNIIHFKQTSPGKYKWIRVGKYLEGELRLNMSEIQFKLGHPQPPESVCSLPCEVGQAKKYVEGEKCCWHCFNCTQYQIRDPDDETQCIVCRQGTVPDETHSTCRDIPEEFLRPGSGWAIGAMSFSATGILVTLFVVGVFLRHNDTPVVRASGRELSYVLLSGILLCYLVTFALVLRPSDIVCGIQRFAAGFCFTVVYAALFTKTNRILRIFNASKRSAKRPSFISPRSQLIICSGLVGVQILINGVWMVIDPARAMHHYPTREDNLLVCNSYIDASYMIAFTYPIILIVVCTVYAVLTRKTPEAFNESKHIGFTMYTTCVIWLAFVPLYFGTGNHVALRITSMSVTISLSASVTIACLFSPKLYIILIRPERNVRQSMMPTRYSTTKNSAMSGTNPSSTLGPIALTSVTCGQNEAIKKHVRTTMDGSTQSEHHELEMISKKNGKVPAAVVTRSTQTQTNNNENDGELPAVKETATSAAKQINRIGNGPITQNDVSS